MKGLGDDEKGYKRHRSGTQVSRFNWGRTKGTIHAFRVMTSSIGTGNVVALTQVNAAFNSVGLNFRLADCPNAAEFTALFDMYKIHHVTVHFLPRFTEGLIGSATGVAPNTCRIWSVLDYDSAAAPADAITMQQYSTCKLQNFWRPSKRTVYPRINDIIHTTGGGTTTGTPIASPWVDCATTTVEHYGMTVGCAEGTTGALQQWQFEAEYYLLFKNSR